MIGQASFRTPTQFRPHVRLGNTRARSFSESLISSRTNGPADPKKGYDVLVIGGGMVGASFACALACTPIASKLKIGVIESTPPVRLEKLGKTPELRVSAVNLSSVELFKAIGAWEGMERLRVCPFYEMEVWDASGPGSIHFDNGLGAHGREPLGFMVENSVMQASLHRRMQSLPNIEIFCPSTVESFQFSKEGTDDWNRVALKDGKVLDARLVVGADGGDSTVRSEAGIPAIGWNYNQRGVVAVVEHSSPNLTAWQRFLPYGPVALLPMYGNYSNVVWSTIPSQAEGLMSLTDEQFLSELRRAFQCTIDAGTMGFNLDRFLPRLPVPFPELPSASPSPPKIERVIGKRASFPLKLTHAVEYVRPRVAVMGDAAHTVHPLAGQGVNLGFGDAATLATVLIEGIQTGQDIGSTVVLRKYQEQRMISNLVMMTGIEGIKRLFESSFMPLTLARNVGLTIVNALSPVKNHLKSYAMDPKVDVSKIGPKKIPLRHKEDTLAEEEPSIQRRLSQIG